MSNKSWKMVQGCERKHKYALRSYALRKSNSMPGVEPYKCQYCGFWHIGHNRRISGSVKANTQQIKVDISE